MQKEEDDKPLDRLYHALQEGLMSRQEMEAEMFGYILSHRRRYGGGVRAEDFEDFLNSQYASLSRAIDRYAECGASFDAYVTVKLCRMARGKTRKARRRRFMESVYRRERGREEEERNVEEFEAQAARDSGAEYGAESPVWRFSGRELLVVLLKTYDRASAGQTEFVAARAGISAARVYDYIDELRKMRVKADERITRRRERAEARFYRLAALRERLREEGPLAAAQTFADAERMARSLQTSRERNARMRTGASNREVALALNIPKGTVDTIVCRVRRMIKMMDSCRNTD